MKRLITTLAVAGIALVLGACHVRPGEPSFQARQDSELAAALDKMQLTQGGIVSNLFNFTITGFTPINETSLVIERGMHDRFLVMLSDPCMSLPFATSVALRSHSGALRDMDTVVVISPRDMDNRCMIKQIYRLNPKTP